MRDVLIISVGMTPQVVTETLWALIKRPEDTRVIPSEVHILTTPEGGKLVNERLLGRSGKLAEFRREFELPAITAQVHEAVYPAGGTFGSQARIAFADLATRVIRMVAANDKTRIHASLGGGLNFMPAFLFGVMSVFGREQDQMSDVQVPPDFAGCPDFWWIPEVPRDLENARDKKIYNTGQPECRIDLSPIPFPHLHRFVAGSILPSDAISFEGLMKHAQISIDAAKISFIEANRAVLIGGECVRLPHRAYAMYRTLAEAARTKRPGVGPHGLGPEHHGWLLMEDFLTYNSWAIESFFRFLPKEGLRNDDDRATSLRQLIDGLASPTGGWPDPALSSIRREGARKELRDLFSQAKHAAKKAIGSHLSDPVQRNRVIIQEKITRNDGTNQTRFGLALLPTEIEA